MERYVVLVFTLLCIYVIFSYAEETKEEAISVSRLESQPNVCMYMHHYVKGTLHLNSIKILLTNLIGGFYCKLRNEFFSPHRFITQLKNARAINLSGINTRIRNLLQYGPI